MEILNCYLESPSQEAIKAATMVSKYLFWMSNKSSEEEFHNAFGKTMGNHFWKKLMELRTISGTTGGDTRLWYEMSTNYRQQLMHYILRSGYKC